MAGKNTDVFPEAARKRNMPLIKLNLRGSHPTLFRYFYSEYGAKRYEGQVKEDCVVPEDISSAGEKAINSHGVDMDVASPKSWLWRDLHAVVVAAAVRILLKRLKNMDTCEARMGFRLGVSLVSRPGHSLISLSISL